MLGTGEEDVGVELGDDEDASTNIAPLGRGAVRDVGLWLLKPQILESSEHWAL